MAKAKMKQVVIPKFSSEAKEVAWWDTHRSEIEAEIRQRVKQKRPLTLDNLLQGAKPSQPVTLRIPKEDLETARRLAARKGLGYQTYMKMLLREALAAGDRAESGVRFVRYDRNQGLELGRDSTKRICFQSYNPFESVYPGLRVVSRETLHLIKTLRSQGYPVVVEPDDGTELCYLAEKGIREFLSDPICAFVIGIPISLILNLIANWLSGLGRPSRPEGVSLVLEIDEAGTRVRYSEHGGTVSDEKFKSIISVLEARKCRFEESTKITPPDPGYPIPIHLEHTGRVVGWSKGFVFDHEKRSIGVDTVEIVDDETRGRIQRGELRGFSVAGIISKATCLICGNQYVDCDHIAGKYYNGKRCMVRTVTRPAEISIVRDPVQPLALIRRAQSVKTGAGTPRTHQSP